MADPFLWYNFYKTDILYLPKSATIRHKRNSIEKLVDSSMTVPPLSVPWLKMDSYRTFEDSKVKITAFLLDPYGPKEILCRRLRLWLSFMTKIMTSMS